MHLDSERRTTVCVCVGWGVGGGASLIDNLEPECSLSRVSNSPIMPTPSFFSFVSSKGSSPTLSLLHNLPLFVGVLVQTHSCIGEKVHIFSSDLNKAGQFLFAMHVN